jgi:5-methyltetrahydropteroyltriglutamate--homocysteine methyltransferase
VVNDGEMSKISYSTYAKDRLTGFEGISQRQMTLTPDFADFPEFAQRVPALLSMVAMPACTGRISYTGGAAVERDCANLKAALLGANPTEAFMTQHRLE